MISFIDDNKLEYGALAICRVLPIAPSTYHRKKYLANNPEKRSRRQQHENYYIYISEIKRIWTDSKCRYGARKVWQQMQADGICVARCTIERLMKQYGLQGVWRGKGKITTNSRDDQKRADDLVNRNLSIRYTDKMTDCGVIASVGTTGDSYDNALAEMVNGLYKAEVIHYLKEQWNGVNDVELATLEWVDWFNKTRLHSTIGYVSPFEFEKRYYDNLNLSGIAA